MFIIVFSVRWSKSDYWIPRATQNSPKCLFCCIVAHTWNTGCSLFSLLYKMCLHCGEVWRLDNLTRGHLSLLYRQIHVYIADTMICSSWLVFYLIHRASKKLTIFSFSHILMPQFPQWRYHEREEIHLDHHNYAISKQLQYIHWIYYISKFKPWKPIPGSKKYKKNWTYLTAII